MGIDADPASRELDGSEADGADAGFDEASAPAQLVGIDRAIAALAARHELVVTTELDDLLETLVGLSCRDQYPDWDLAELAQRRKEGRRAAEDMREAADEMLSALEKLYHAFLKFDERVAFNPGLLEAIFDVHTGGPDNLFIPPKIAILQTLFRSAWDDARDNFDGDSDDAPDEDTENGSRATEEQRGATAKELPLVVPYKPCPAGFWDEVDQRLTAVSALPVRPVLATGPVPNVMLRKALIACRAYWTTVHGKSWALSSLRHKEVRRENRIETLAGPCEKFVADVLAVAEIRFTLTELASTWSSVENALKKASPQP